MIKLNWIKQKAPYVTWGMPHKKGTLQEEDTFVLKDGEHTIPVQTKANAYWNDGSVKWTLHSAVFSGPPADQYTLSTGEASCENPILIIDTDQTITVDTGKIKAVLPKSGLDCIQSIHCGEQLRCSGGRLVVKNENRYVTEGCETTIKEDFIGDISECEVEEAGELRCVVRMRGSHVCKNNRSRHGQLRRFLPFELRWYFYAGTDEIQLSHTFLFDGQQNTDFIRGMGVVFDVPLEGPLYNRYVRFAGERGMYADSPKSLLTWRTTGKYKELYQKQVRCEPVAFDAVEDMDFLGLLDESAVWDEFKLSQLSSEEYTVYKRVGQGLSFIHGHAGKRAMGCAYAGDASGGMTVHMEHFWQKHPSSFQCVGMTGETAQMAAWFWSPDGKAMDLRHYDTRAHVYSGYEGFDEMRATPYGVANTNRLTLKMTNGPVGNDELLTDAERWNRPVLLIPADLSYYNSTRVLGEWSLPDRSSVKKAQVEDQLDALTDYYKREIDQRRWYGFWDFGDFMHTYDDVHHCWKYDMGGQAWQNTELVPNLWLWYSFLRSGREDFFQMAEAMTRHTSEVDVYHLGEYAGLGSRHNVVHWGCGCKECRISMAGLHKIYYYLTGNERVGDIMDEVRDADAAVGSLDPMRSYYSPSTRFKTHVRFGPDVMAFCSNWFTYWERHRDKKYLEKLTKTLEFFKQGQRFVLSGVYGYDPATTEYYDYEVQGGSHFMHCFGNFPVWLEIANCFDDTLIKERLMDLGQFYGQNPEDAAYREKLCSKWGYPEIAKSKLFRHASYNVAISAYSAKHRENTGLAKEIWQMIFHDLWVPMPLQETTVDTGDCHCRLQEVPGMNTNGAAQWASNAIFAMNYLD